MEKWSIADGKKVIVSCLTSFSSHLPSIPVLGLTSLLTTRQNLCNSSTQQTNSSYHCRSLRMVIRQHLRLSMYFPVVLYDLPPVVPSSVFSKYIDLYLSFYSESLKSSQNFFFLVIWDSLNPVFPDCDHLYGLSIKYLSISLELEPCFLFIGSISSPRESTSVYIKYYS